MAKAITELDVKTLGLGTFKKTDGKDEKNQAITYYRIYFKDRDFWSFKGTVKLQVKPKKDYIQYSAMIIISYETAKVIQAAYGHTCTLLIPKYNEPLKLNVKSAQALRDGGNYRSPVYGELTPEGELIPGNKYFIYAKIDTRNGSPYELITGLNDDGSIKKVALPLRKLENKFVVGDVSIGFSNICKSAKLGLQFNLGTVTVMEIIDGRADMSKSPETMKFIQENKAILEKLSQEILDGLDLDSKSVLHSGEGDHPDEFTVPGEGGGKVSSPGKEGVREGAKGSREGHSLGDSAKEIRDALSLPN
jgi:hypothetical protein